MDLTGTKLLVVDDEHGLRELLEIVLAKRGFAVATVATGEEALARCARERFDLIIQDVRMPGMGGLRLLEKLRGMCPETPVVIMTAYSTWDSATEAMRLGAFDYVRKPFVTEEILKIISRAIEHQRLRRDGLGKLLDEKGPLIVGTNQRMRDLFALVKQVAATDSTVLVRGESGTGKELVARSIHCRSPRAAFPFISVNCSAFPETLLESELFGYLRGAFTGAADDKKGLMTVADKGTLFLDEIAEMSPKTQVKLLRVIEERTVLPLGATAAVSFDARIIAATNRDMERDIASGALREDLYYRLNVIPLEVPPLRERKEDIPLLAGYFLAKYSSRMGKDVRGISPTAQDTLLRHDWPGNVRELENVIQRYVALAQGPTIGEIEIRSTRAQDRPPPPEGIAIPEGGIDLEALVSSHERRYLEAALARTGGNMAQAAKILGLTYRSIRYKVKKLGITSPCKPQDECVKA
ncbi:MAG TPA: Fis family transcriptional regulator [Planctomycetes bacterium]|nr:Fis family transcriptional regulator [Planctomycetota bacterium]